MTRPPIAEVWPYCVNPGCTHLPAASPLNSIGCVESNEPKEGDGDAECGDGGGHGDDGSDGTDGDGGGDANAGMWMLATNVMLPMVLPAPDFLCAHFEQAPLSALCILFIVLLPFL